MNGSRDSQPPRFTPRTGAVGPYVQLWFRGGVWLFALAVSSHVEFRPMIGSPPTVALV